MLIDCNITPAVRRRFRACLQGAGGPQIGGVTCGGSPHLSCKRDQIKMRDYVDRRVTHQRGLPQLHGVPHLHVNRTLVFKLNPGPSQQGVNSTHLWQASRAKSRSARNASNLIEIKWASITKHQAIVDCCCFVYQMCNQLEIGRQTLLTIYVKTNTISSQLPRPGCKREMMQSEVNCAQLVMS